MPSLVKEIFLASHALHLLIQDGKPVVKYIDELFMHLSLLVQKIPALSDKQYIEEFAEISNFFWKGLDFFYIECITTYQEQYCMQVQLEKRCPSDIFPYRLTDYKIFDVSYMHEPLVEEEEAIYFVYHAKTGIPYRVVCPFPYIHQSTLVHYQILPLANE